MHSTQIDSKSNLSFSYSKDNSPTDYRLCYGWELLKRAMVKVSWSPIVYFDGYRSADNFAFSDFMALDFDGGLSIAEVAEIFRDSAFLIGTTKSHLLDKGGVIAERFRLVVPWERRITSRAEYLASIAAYIKKYLADTQCKDAARLFYKCREIIHFQDPEPGLELATVTPPEPKREYEPRINQHTGERMLSSNIINFLTRGLAFGEGRNISVFITALELFASGQSEHEIIDLIKGAPFERKGFSDREIESTVRSAIKRG